MRDARSLRILALSTGLEGEHLNYTFPGTGIFFALYVTLVLFEATLRIVSLTTCLANGSNALIYISSKKRLNRGW